MKTRTTYGEVTRGLLGAFVLLIILFAFIGYYVGATLETSTVTIAQTTQTVTGATVTVTAVSSFTVTSNYLSTTFTYQTVTYTGPPRVTLSGTATSKTVGTTAQNVVFVSASRNGTFAAKVTNGQYTIELPNYDGYNAFIEYSTAVGVGNGRCPAGAALVYSITNSTTFNWQC